MKTRYKYTHETVAGLFVVIGLVIVAYMTIKLGNFSLFGDQSFPLIARFSTVTGLRVGNPVEMHGIEVGYVADLAIDQKRQRAMATLKIHKGIDVYSDAIASIKTAGLIGDKFIDIDPGGGGDLLKPGETIINTESPADLGELIGKYAFGSMDAKQDGGSGLDDNAINSAPSDGGLDLDLNLNLDE